MHYKRSAGILLHPTSLPGKFGIGDLGDSAFRFIDFLSKSGQTLWQIFPLGPTGYGDSPYQCFSAFAGNPLLISPELLLRENLLSSDDLNNFPEFNNSIIDYGNVIIEKSKLLKLAFSNFNKLKKSSEIEFIQFCDGNKEWLDNYALFMAVKEFHGGIQWTMWSKDIAFREPGSIEKWERKLTEEINFQKFVQYYFIKQWKNVKNYANQNGIKIIGDLPIFIAYDSADLWANKHLFTVDNNGKLETVAGVPPDYFSPTGQLWGNPLYRWNEMEANDFAWWKSRLTKMYELVDIIRIDHFRGLDAFWEIPGDAETAVNGKWINAPGEKLFASIKKDLGDVPILAEDLGVITPTVEKLRDDFGFPGMKILQFAFGESGDKNFLPHNHIKNCVVYTGSHDNDTTRGFFETEKKNGSGIYDWAANYLSYEGNDIRLSLIKAAYSSVANIVIIPMQDILNLGTEARMNFPGRPGGNWTWRFTWEHISDNLIETYKNFSLIYERPKIKVD